ncbi:DUF2339 domain-containing protein [Okibacterium fritillariae]|uniref:Uncharacterized protein n=1 Tax=Okibacterium fritillariae TaxID=123320 RepID=A0A1T5KJ03_9MICO|nr:hypothetical protein [Okibacterium fritillariae]SKC63439.1 hypothetical protein SAMN06309945_2272 [Okibacterium fritillariae]
MSVPLDTNPRAGRRTERVRSNLGTSQLGSGLAVAGAFIVANGLWRFLTHIGDYPRLPLNVAAWAVFAVSVALIAWLVRRRGYLLDLPVFILLLAALGATVALDLTAIWGLSGARLYPSASVAVGGALLAAVTLRPAREVAVVTALLGLALVAVFLSEQRSSPATIAPQLLTLTLTVGPAFVGCAVVASYRRMVRMALDRVLIQSTVAAPAFGVSMLETEELAALDREVEELFADVSSGREPLPLTPARASRAQELATELRQHLVQNRSTSWLVHAIAESEFLGDSIDVVDPHGLAATLDQRQRDGLLSALWLLISANPRQVPSVELRFPALPLPPVDTPMQRFPLVIVVEGVRRTAVEPGTWLGFSRVGSYVDAARPLGITVEIECTVESPAARTPSRH